MIRICINTQTPPIRPLGRAGPSDPAAVWRRGIDYSENVGGVVPMMRAFLGSAIGSWVAPSPRWIALGSPGLPPEVRTDEGYILETFPIDPATKAGYTRFKEAIWRSFHGPSSFQWPFEDYRSFVAYGARTADRLLEHIGEYDAFYVNDFQQIHVGTLVGSSAPALLRWHIPLELKGYPEPVRRFFLRAMEGFDGIIVSTRAGLEELIHTGFQGRAFQLYPYIDPAEQTIASDAQVAHFRDHFGLPLDAPVVLSIGRMDPVKRQDLLIRAFASVHRSHPKARLLLVGGGSFSTRALSTGSALSKAEAWRVALQKLVRKLRLEEVVVFTGSLEPAEVQAAYSAADVFVHPSPWEGFGLVVVEAWAHHLPVVVSRGAGVAELVDDDLNGFTVAPGEVRPLADRIRYLLDHREIARRLGEYGAFAAQRCHVRRAVPRLKEIFERVIRLYSWRGKNPEPHP